MNIFKIIVVTITCSALFVSANAFDFGKIISEVIEEQVDQVKTEAKNKVEQNIASSLTKSFPKLAKLARLDDGKPVDLSKGIIVFGYQGCPPSRQTYAYMKRNNIKYTLMDVAKDKKAVRIAREQGLPGSPTVFINGKKIVGYQPSVYDHFLKR